MGKIRHVEIARAIIKEAIIIITQEYKKHKRAKEIL